MVSCGINVSELGVKKDDGYRSLQILIKNMNPIYSHDTIHEVLMLPVIFQKDNEAMMPMHGILVGSGSEDVSICSDLRAVISHLFNVLPNPLSEMT